MNYARNVAGYVTMIVGGKPVQVPIPVPVLQVRRAERVRARRPEALLAVLAVDLEKRMNHKRGKPKNARAGCLMCKPHKMNGGKRSFALEPIKTGGGRMRREAASREDMRECAA